MRVHYRTSYIKANSHKPSEDWWRAHHLARAVKHGVLGQNSICDIHLEDGSSLRIDASNAHMCRLWFGRFILKHVSEKIAGPCLIVPVPSKDALVGVNDSRSTSMTKAALNDACGVSVIDPLRYTEQLTKSSEGGPRDPNTLYRYLTCILPSPPHANIPVVIVDDFLTTSGSMKAVAVRLREAGYNVAFAVVWARTVLDTTNVNPLEEGYEDIEDWSPNALFEESAVFHIP